MRIGKLLIKWRLLNDLSQRDFSRELGFSSATLMRVEHGYEPDVRTFKKILDWMMEDDGKRCQPQKRRSMPLSKT